ncbi:Sel1 repeat-containing protein [Pseudomonas fluorescens]|uniref:SEL1-like repeat protein n=1 Tax=Pseudomonas fluorescens TaxID=294 RepID=UPI00054C581A|nr:Sel1 repeat-containing protein [Pseudomonas fluorescens]
MPGNVLNNRVGVRKLLLAFFSFLMVMACSKKEAHTPDATSVDLEFKCVYERDSLSTLNPDADIFYRYGLYLETRKGQKDYDAIARYYRIAAAHDHYKAATNLQFLLSTGQASSPDAGKETIDLVEYYVAMGIPGAYYDMAHYLELGYGVKQDVAASRAYFRRAADLGNPDAQYYIGRLLSYVPNTADIMLEMYKCSMEQGNRSAGARYAVYSQGSELYQDALYGHQTAVRNGDVTSAHSLAIAFKGPPASDELYYLALQQDDERVDRYNKISFFLSRHEHLGAKIPDLDDIVPLPLPPATLPEWDGTFQWKRERDSAVPIIPSAELIEKLSAEKGLDPATGLPLPKNAGDSN